MATQLGESWKVVLNDEFEKSYTKELREFLKIEKTASKIIYPPNQLIFNAFNHTPFNKVKVIIIGQDPYHGAGQAHGLSFSVQNGIAIPPSLKNIFKELQADIPEFNNPTNGDLTSWADQGVLLLNSTLTVEASKPGSHQKQGWERFTDKVISELSSQRSGLVFLLWGRYAHSKENLIANSKHYILKAAHPSPFSAHSGFFGCRHFSKTNTYLKENALIEINWQL